MVGCLATPTYHASIRPALSITSVSCGLSKCHSTLTPFTIENLKATGTERYDVFDAKVPGLVIRVSASSKTWGFIYQFKNVKRRLGGIGRFPGVTLEEARKKVRAARDLLDAGKDPVLEQRAKEQDLQDNIYGPLLTAYLADYAARKPKTTQLYRNSMKFLLTVPEWNDLPVKNMTRVQLIKQHKIVGARSVAQAKHFAVFIGAFFHWLHDLGKTDKSIGRLEQYAEVEPRTRVLTDEEIAVLWRCTYKQPLFGTAFRLLLLTAARKMEIGALRWKEVNGQFLDIPASRMKGKHNYRAPLSALALEQLASVQKMVGCDFVFTADGVSYLTGFDYAKGVLVKEIQKELPDFTDFRTHDLRRTATTILSKKLKVKPHILDRILAHVPAKGNTTRGHYNFDDYDEEVSARV